MAKKGISTKRVAISKANAQTVAVVGVASFITIFCLVASSAVWSQNKYLSRVITTKNIANAQLKKNVQAFTSLSNSYDNFVAQSPNAIGGYPTGAASNDGTNAKIILDALPSSYDFPALTASIEKILTDHQFTVTSITGTDDQIAQASNTSSPKPQPVPIPFSFTVTNANYGTLQQLTSLLQQSIRPIQIDTINVSGSSNSLQVTITAHTYYQPGKSLTITKKVVK